jgi:Phage integrase family
MFYSFQPLRLLSFDLCPYPFKALARRQFRFLAWCAALAVALWVPWNRAAAQTRASTAITLATTAAGSPVAKAGIRKIRLHDLRHTSGSLVLQNGASIVHVKEQMGHSSIQVPVDIYGHLIPGANVCFVDRLDGAPTQEARTGPQQSATPAQPGETEIPRTSCKLLKGFGGGAWTRTTDLRIMRPSL